MSFCKARAETSIRPRNHTLASSAFLHASQCPVARWRVFFAWLPRRTATLPKSYRKITYTSYYVLEETLGEARSAAILSSVAAMVGSNKLMNTNSAFGVSLSGPCPTFSQLLLHLATWRAKQFTAASCHLPCYSLVMSHSLSCSQQTVATKLHAN